jgi:hypothetical protein
MCKYLYKSAAMKNSQKEGSMEKGAKKRWWDQACDDLPEMGTKGLIR